LHKIVILAVLTNGYDEEQRRIYDVGVLYGES